MKSFANAEAYLAALPADRRAAIEAVRAFVNRHLPEGYRETIAFGMLAWCVPLEVYPDTYNKQPLLYAALSSQKNYMALYLQTVYGDPGLEAKFRTSYASAGKKLDMGKSCVRFRSLDDLHLPAIEKAISACSMAEFVRRAQAVTGSAGRAARAAAKQATAAAKAKPAAAGRGKQAAKPSAAKPMPATAARGKASR